VAIGDSTTAGTPGFRSPLEVPPDGDGDQTSQFSFWLMQAHPDWSVLNRGVNGERSDQIRARFQRDVIEEHPDAVVVLAGVNDIYQRRSAESVERELTAMYLAAIDAHIPVIAATIIPYNTATADANARMHAVNDWIRSQAAQSNGTIVFSDTRAAAASLESPDRLASSPDDLHPSPDGYRCMATALEPLLNRVLSSR
jgi:lysophospholipase L1-like esterase